MPPRERGNIAGLIRNSTRVVSRSSESRILGLDLVKAWCVRQEREREREPDLHPTDSGPKSGLKGLLYSETCLRN